MYSIYVVTCQIYIPISLFEGDNLLEMHYIPNMYLESYMSRMLDIPKYRANKDKDKINLVYFIRYIHYKLVSYDKQCLPHSSGEFKFKIN
jgi:hypothetical protein